MCTCTFVDDHRIIVTYISTAGSDYTALVNEVLTFTLTSPQRLCVTIDILDDQLVEPAEDFTVRIDQTTSQGLVSDQASVTILDSNY